jgi:hypothetical protein
MTSVALDVPRHRLVSCPLSAGSHAHRRPPAIIVVVIVLIVWTPEQLITIMLAMFAAGVIPLAERPALAWD